MILAAPSVVVAQRRVRWRMAWSVPESLVVRGRRRRGLQRVRSQGGITAFLAGNTGTRMGGFFRRAIKAVADLTGLTFRIAGLAGQMLARLGTVPRQLSVREIRSELEEGAIDAAEWTVPYDDEKLGLGRVAKFDCTPGFRDGGASLHGIVDDEAWDTLPADSKAAFESAGCEANVHMTARHDNLSPSAMRRLLAGGVQRRAFPEPAMDAAYEAVQEAHADLNGKNPEFRKLFDSYTGFQREQLAWHGVAEQRFDPFMQSARG